MPLGFNAKAALTNANPSDVVVALSRVGRYLASERWLGARNRYHRDTVKRIVADHASGAVNQKHLAEYIAASSILHLMDGWSYLGRSFGATACGDTAAARHLAYYAELRAAMTILSIYGIGVFDHQHFVVVSPTSVNMIPGGGGTHVFASDALEWWAGQPSATKMLGASIRPEGIPLDSWLTALPRYASWSPLAREMVLALGVDLKRLASDRRMRNEASYRPRTATALTPGDAAPVAQFLVQTWAALEPSPLISNIDLHHLRRLFEKSFLVVEGRRNKKKYSAAAEALLKTQGISETRSEQMHSFLRRAVIPDDLELIRLAAKSSTNPRELHMSMMSRAVLLLGVASSMAVSQWRQAGLDLRHVAWWWGPLGVERGLWTNRPSVGDLRSLWADTELDLDLLENWIDGGGGSPAELFELCATATVRLGQFELAGLWSQAS